MHATIWAIHRLKRINFMKIAIVGSRSLQVKDLENYIPENVTEIVSGGAVGIDSCARQYARKKGLRLTEFFPNYEKYDSKAPLVRNLQIIEYADSVIAFWDGKSTGTRHVINHCREQNKKIRVFMPIST